MSSETSPLSRFLRRLAAFAGLQSLIIAVVICFGSPYDANHYLRSLEDKLARLETCPGPRLVILGGSSVAFGIQSEQLRAATGLEPVNVGLHMSLGLNHNLEYVRRHGRSGDVVVLLPEYHLLASDLQDGDPKLVGQLLEQWPEAKRYFDRDAHDSWKRFLDRDALWKSHEWFKRAVIAIRKGPPKDDIYRRTSFNEYGDVVAHYGQQPQFFLTNSPLTEVDLERIDRTVDLLNDFALQCRRRDITVYLSYPPISQKVYEKSNHVIDRIDREFAARLDFPVLHHPQDFVFPSEYFFDTDYHLNQKGGQRRTQKLAAAVSQMENSPTRLVERNRREKTQAR